LWDFGEGWGKGGAGVEKGAKTKDSERSEFDPDDVLVGRVKRSSNVRKQGGQAGTLNNTLGEKEKMNKLGPVRWWANFVRPQGRREKSLINLGGRREQERGKEIEETNEVALFHS